MIKPARLRSLWSTEIVKARAAYRAAGDTAAIRNLRGVVFRLNGRLTTTAGMARYRRGEPGIVELSPKLFGQEEATEAQAINTLRHEIAHIAVGPGHGHDRVWKASARRIGCDAERCHTMAAAKRVRRRRMVHVDCPKCGYRLSTAGPLPHRVATDAIRGLRSMCCARKVILVHSHMETAG
tara:strand:+ start:1195 stop:1737 length:543 start_codon:yes stop_codon:yes gene_type:complete